MHRFIIQKHIFSKILKINLLERRLNCNTKSNEIENVTNESLGEYNGEICFQIESELALSKSLCSAWHSVEESENAHAINVKVISQRLWPGRAFNFQFTPNLQRYCSQFEDFFKRKFSKKCLKWRADQGRAKLYVFYNK